MSEDGIRRDYEALPRWCGVKDAARFLGVSTRTVYQMLSDGDVFGAWRRNDTGRWRIPKDSLAALIGLPVEEAGDAA